MYFKNFPYVSFRSVCNGCYCPYVLKPYVVWPVSMCWVRTDILFPSNMMRSLLFLSRYVFVARVMFIVDDSNYFVHTMLLLLPYSNDVAEYLLCVERCFYIMFFQYIFDTLNCYYCMRRVNLSCFSCPVCVLQLDVQCIYLEVKPFCCTFWFSLVIPLPLFSLSVSRRDVTVGSTRVLNIPWNLTVVVSCHVEVIMCLFS